MHLATRAAGTLATLTLSLGALSLTTGPAVAAPETAPDQGGKPAACAQQEKQLDRAEDALARLTAVFEKKQDKVAQEKKESKAADTAVERREAKRDLAEARKAAAEAKQAKKAQQQRVAKASERLEKCQAEPTEPTEPTEPSEPAGV